MAGHQRAIFDIPHVVSGLISNGLNQHWPKPFKLDKSNRLGYSNQIHEDNSHFPISYPGY